MRRFNSLGQAQRFLSTVGLIRDHFHLEQLPLTAPDIAQNSVRDFKIGEKSLGYNRLRKLSEPDN